MFENLSKENKIFDVSTLLMRPHQHTWRPIEGMFGFEPDVSAYFPDSQAVNTALRSLLAIMEQMPTVTSSRKVS